MGRLTTLDPLFEFTGSHKGRTAIIAALYIFFLLSVCLPSLPNTNPFSPQVNMPLPNKNCHSLIEIKYIRYYKSHSQQKYWFPDNIQLTSHLLPTGLSVLQVIIRHVCSTVAHNLIWTLASLFKHQTKLSNRIKLLFCYCFFLFVFQLSTNYSNQK